MRSLRESRQVKLSRLLARRRLVEEKFNRSKAHWKLFFNHKSGSEALDICMDLMNTYRLELVKLNKKIKRLKRKIKEKN